MITRLVLVAVAMTALACACTGHHDVSAPATLPATAVPYLPSSTTTLTPAGLAREAQDRALSGELDGWGYLGGRRRSFQGSSHDLQLVDSRTLRFRDAAGATAFVAFARRHAAAYLGSFPQVRRYAVGRRRGILATGQACRCHLANPALLAVVSRGDTVSWLEINGPKATPHRLTTLLAQAP